MVRRSEIIEWCNQFLSSQRFQDASVNGLQVEGREEIGRVALAVSASAHTIEGAVDWGADALLVHHGLLWGGSMRPVTGLFARRLRLLLANDLNLIAYHLPLDAHPEIGNNAVIARRLGLVPVLGSDDMGGIPIGLVATTEPAREVRELAADVGRLTDHDPLILGSERPVARVAILSGSGYSALEEAAALGCEALLTGDVRESTMAEARELGITVIVAGHEATERWGVQALGERLSERFGVETHFIHDPNPI